MKSSTSAYSDFGAQSRANGLALHLRRVLSSSLRGCGSVRVTLSGRGGWSFGVISFTGLPVLWVGPSGVTQYHMRNWAKVNSSRLAGLNKRRQDKA